MALAGAARVADDGVRPTLNEPTWPAPAGQVSALFWILAPVAALCGIGATLGWWSGQSAPITLAAIAVMLIGGLPHGACDMSLAATAWRLDRAAMAKILALYIGVAALMAALWWLTPVIALIVFLALAGLHFGEDWAMLPPGLLRMMAGLSVITVAALGQPTQVTALFFAMTGSPLAEQIAHWAAAAAPMTLLVTLVGAAGAWRAGHSTWVLAQTLGYALLFVLPPVLGFAVFFVGLHAPLHWREVVRRLPHIRLASARTEGAALTALVLLVWCGALWRFGLVSHAVPGTVRIGGAAFCLLSIVAAPHLALSLAIGRRIDRARAPV